MLVYRTKSILDESFNTGIMIRIDFSLHGALSTNSVVVSRISWTSAKKWLSIDEETSLCADLQQ